MEDASDDRPCVLKLLGVVKIAIDWLLCLFALPLWGLLLLTRSIVNNDGFAQSIIQKPNSGNLYLFLAFIPRFIVTLLFLAVLGVELGCVAYFWIYREYGMHAGALGGTLGGAVVLLLYGFISLRRSTNKRWPHLNISILDYWAGLGSSWVDFITFLFLIPAQLLSFVVFLCSSWCIKYQQKPFWTRIDQMVRSLPELWGRAWYHWCGALADALLLPIVLVLTVTVYRVRLMRHRLGQLAPDAAGDCRLLVLEHAFKFLIDLLPFIFGCIVFVTHRSPRLGRRLSAAASVDEWRLIFLQELIALFFDLPFILLLPLLMLAPWRMYTLISSWGKFQSSWEKRGLIANCAAMAIADWPTLAAATILAVSIYRATIGYEKYGAAQDDGSLAGMWRGHGVVWEQLGHLLIDIPCVVAGLIVLICLWRAWELAADWTVFHSVCDRRKSCLYHFGHILIDLPCITIMLITSLLLYRIPTLYEELAKCPKINDRRRIILFQALQMLIDLPFIAGLGLIFIMVWRLPFCLKNLFDGSTANHRRRAVLQNLALGLLDPICLAILVLVRMTTYRWAGMWGQLTAATSAWAPFDPTNTINPFQAHLVVLKEVLEMVVDLPCAVAAFFVCLGLFRIATFHREFLLAQTACERRVVCVEQLAWTILDLPFVILFFITLLISVPSSLGIRSWWLLRDNYGFNTASQRRWCTVQHFGLMWLDLVCIPAAILASYRWPHLYQDLVKSVEWFDKGPLCHLLVLECAVNIIFDVPFWVPFAICMLTGWRAPALLKELRKPESDNFTYRFQCLRHFGCLILDILSLAATALIFVTVVRAPSLLRRFNAVCRRKLEHPTPALHPIIPYSAAVDDEKEGRREPPTAPSSGAAPTAPYSGPPPAAPPSGSAPADHSSGLAPPAPPSDSAPSSAVLGPSLFSPGRRLTGRAPTPELAERKISVDAAPLNAADLAPAPPISRGSRLPIVSAAPLPSSSCSLYYCGDGDAGVYAAIWLEAVYMLIDLPIAMILLMQLPFVWRSPVLLRQFVQTWGKDDWWRRILVLRHAVLLLLDLVCLPLFVITFVGLWRVPNFLAKIDPPFRRRAAFAPPDYGSVSIAVPLSPSPSSAPRPTSISSSASANGTHPAEAANGPPSSAASAAVVAIGPPSLAASAAVFPGSSAAAVDILPPQSAAATHLPASAALPLAVGGPGWGEFYMGVMGGGTDVHSTVASEGLLTVISIPICVLLWVLLLVPWRHGMTLNICVQIDNRKRHQRLLMQGLLLLLDLPIVAFVVLLLCSWRGPHTFRRLYHADLQTLGLTHRIILHETGQYLLDLPFVLMTISLVPFIHRWPLMWAQLRGSETDGTKRCAIWHQFYLAYVFDTLSIVCAILMCVVPWRIPTVVTRLFLVHSQRALQRAQRHSHNINTHQKDSADQKSSSQESYQGDRKDSSYQGDRKEDDRKIEVWTDDRKQTEIDVRPGDIGIGGDDELQSIDGSVWLRWFSCDDWQAVILSEFGSWLVDLPFAILFATMFAGPPIAGYLVSTLLLPQLPSSVWAAAGIVALALVLFIPWRGLLLARDLATATSHRRKCVALHACAFMLDHVALLVRAIVLVTVWRNDGLRQRLWSARPFTASFRAGDGFGWFLSGHGEVLLTATLLCVDVLCLVPATFLLLTLWRAKGFVEEMAATSSSKRRWLITWQNAGQLVIDIPFIALFVMLTCVAWHRVPTLWKEATPYQNPSDWARRYAVVHQFVEFCKDLPFFLFGALILGYPVALFFAARSFIPNSIGLACTTALLSITVPFRWWSLVTDLRLVTCASERRSAVAIQLGLAVLDPLALLSMLLLAVCGVYRCVIASLDLYLAHGLFSNYSPLQPTSRRFESHLIIFHHVGQLLIDIPCWIMASVVFLTGWRAKPLCDEMVAANPFFEKVRWACLYHFANLLLDLPFMAVAVVVGSSIYRLPNVGSIVYNLPPNARRWPLFDQLLQLILDIPFWCFAIVSSLAVWRLPTFLYDVLVVASTQEHRRRAALENLLLAILDPFALLAFVVLCSLGGYRMFCNGGFWSELRQACSPFANIRLAGIVAHPCWHVDGGRLECHALLLKELCLWLIDLPGLIAGLIILLTGWRAKSLIERLYPQVEWGHLCRKLCNCAGASDAAIKQRRLAIEKGDFSDDHKSAGQLDGVPTAIKARILWPMLADKDLNGVARVSREWKSLCQHEAQTRPPLIRAPLFGANAVSPKAFSAVCWSEFVEWSMDLPFIALGLLVMGSLYRAPAYVRDMWSTCKDARTRRWSTAAHFCRFLFDILLLPASVFLTLSVYRAPSVWASRDQWFAPIKGDGTGFVAEYYGEICLAFGHLLIDIPFLVMGAATFVSVWRGVLLAQDLSDLPPGSAHLHSAHRFLCFYHFAMIVPDLLCGTLFLILGATIWRLPTLFAYWTRVVPNISQRRGMTHYTILLCFGLWFLDVLTLVPLLIITGLVQRIIPAVKKTRRLIVLHARGGPAPVCPAQTNTKTPAPTRVQTAEAGDEKDAPPPVKAQFGAASDEKQAPPSSKVETAPSSKVETAAADDEKEAPSQASIGAKLGTRVCWGPNCAAARHSVGIRQYPGAWWNTILWPKPGAFERKRPCNDCRWCHMNCLWCFRTREKDDEEAAEARVEDLYARCAQEWDEEDHLSPCHEEQYRHGAECLALGVVGDQINSPLSLSFFRPLIWLEMWVSIKRIPNFLLYPLRLIGYCFLPVHFYVLWRLGRKHINDDENANGVTLSFLFDGIVWLQQKEPTFESFYRMERFLVVNLLTIPLMLLNEVGVVIMGVHALIIFMLSFGITGQITRETAGNCIFRLAQIAQALQGLLILVLAFVEVNLWMAPIYAASNGIAAVFKGEGQIEWLFRPERPELVWPMWVFFLVAFAAALHMTVKLCMRIFAIFRPWEFWRRLVLFKSYAALLAAITHGSYKLARGPNANCCSRLVGELALFLFTCLWILWPSFIVIAFEAWPYLGLTGAFNIVALFAAISIVRRSWAPNPQQ